MKRASSQLTTNGVELLADPRVSRSHDYAVFKSVEGLPIVVLEARSDRAAVEPSFRMDDELGFTLVHTAVLTDNLAESEEFWRGNFGLYRFGFNDCQGSGFMALADDSWRPDTHNVFMEILSPPNVLNIDQYGYDLAGQSFFHLGYGTNNVWRAWRYLVNKGLFPGLEPYEEAGTGALDSFVFGLDKVAFEIFGGVDDLLNTKDIKELDLRFCVDAAQMTESSGDFHPYPEGQNLALNLD